MGTKTEFPHLYTATQRNLRREARNAERVTLRNEYSGLLSHWRIADQPLEGAMCLRYFSRVLIWESGEPLKPKRTYSRRPPPPQVPTIAEAGYCVSPTWSRRGLLMLTRKRDGSRSIWRKSSRPSRSIPSLRVRSKRAYLVFVRPWVLFPSTSA